MAMEEEIVIASSSSDEGIGSWNLWTGKECRRYKSCLSSTHGLTCISNCFIASSQVTSRKASSGSVFYWSLSKPQVEVKSSLEEPTKPLAANSEGTYLVGGGLSGSIYLWEIPSGRLLKKWNAHYRAVTCLVFSDDNSLLISGSEDGSVKVWSLFRIFDDYQSKQASHLYEFYFSEHTLSVTDLIVGAGGGKGIIVSSSEDRTCKVWSLSSGQLLKTMAFPSAIDAIALDPLEHVFYAGGRDGKIYTAALNACASSIESKWLHSFGSLSGHGKAVSCLMYSVDANLLLAGLEDGIIQVWDPVTQNMVRIFKLGKGPVNNIAIIKQQSHQNPQALSDTQTSSRKKGLQSLPPLQKYVRETDGNMGADPVVCLRGTCSNVPEFMSSSQRLALYSKEIQQEGSSAAAELEVEKLKNECKESKLLLQKWKKMFDNLHGYCVNELLDADKKLLQSKPLPQTS